MKIKLIIPLFILLFLTSCTQVITNTCDEIRLNSWCAELKNGSVVTLKFEDDIARFQIKSDDKEAQTRIKGNCFFENNKMVIYNFDDLEPYCFEYKLKNNKLTLKHSRGKLVLTRCN